MTIFSQYGFVAGEVSPRLKGRTDLTKYVLGAETLRNFLVGKQGGAYSRAGMQFGVPATFGEATRLFRFKATVSDYILVFEDQILRVMRNGGYLVEGALDITDVDPDTDITVEHSGGTLTVDSLVYITSVTGTSQLNGRYFRVATTASGSITLADMEGNIVDGSAYGAYASDGYLYPVVQVETPYLAEDLAGLAVEQELIAGVTSFTITSLDYKTRRLTYTNDTTWSLDAIDFGNDLTAPSGLATTPSSAGSAGAAFAITAVVDGVESLPSAYVYEDASSYYADTSNTHSIKVTWDSVPEADWYNLYRSLVLPDAGELSRAQEVGYIGRAFGTQFTDNYIVADFTKTPPMYLNPFADGAVTYIEVTNGGTGYDNADTLSLSIGSGFVGYPVVDESGVIVGIVVLNGGEGYTSSSVVTVTTSGGSGATFDVNVTDASGNNPRLYKRFQQRGIYAATVNYPMTLWGSKVGALDNFDVSVEVVDSDSYSFEMDGVVVEPIKHLVSLRNGLLAFTDEVITQFRAGQGQALTPTNAVAEPQAYKGVSDAQPVLVGFDVCFTQPITGHLYAMQYSQYYDQFELVDTSVLSEHFVGESRQIERMQFVEDLDKVIWAVREDGKLLTLTYDKDEQVYGWAQHQTRGRVRDILAVKEENRQYLYAVVERPINGVWRKSIEFLAPRTFAHVEDYVGVDSSLYRSGTYPNATLTPSAATGSITLSASGAVLGALAAGDIVYVAGGTVEITAVNSTTQVTGTVLRDLTDLLPEDDANTPLPQASGKWYWLRPTTTIGGLWHLEGETVQALADGSVVEGLVVSDGQITLNNPAAKIVVGLGYSSRLKTLPPTMPQNHVESKPRTPGQVDVRVDETRGLALGPSFDRMEEVKEDNDEQWNEAINVLSGMVELSIYGESNKEGAICIEQRYPLPATILAVHTDYNFGADDVAG